MRSRARHDNLRKFRRLIEENKLGEKLFADVGRVLQASKIKLNSGTVVDATLISAPSPTKNEQKVPDLKCTRHVRENSGISARSCTSD